jgi:hypothetical protein
MPSIIKYTMIQNVYAQIMFKHNLNPIEFHKQRKPSNACIQQGIDFIFAMNS